MAEYGDPFSIPQTSIDQALSFFSPPSSLSDGYGLFPTGMDASNVQAASGGGDGFNLGQLTNLLQGGGNILATLFGARQAAQRRDPFAETALLEQLQAATNARTFSAAAADPNSPWMRNLAALYRESQIAQGMEGIRQYQRVQQRAQARGVPSARSERRSEAESSAVADLFRRADMNSTEAARSALLQAASGSSGAAGALSSPNQLLTLYGQLENQRQRDLPLLFREAGRSIGSSLKDVFPKTLADYKPPPERTPGTAPYLALFGQSY